MVRPDGDGVGGFIKICGDLAETRESARHAPTSSFGSPTPPEVPKPELERVFKRLPTRIVFFVFAVTLITSLTVAAVSVRSTRNFLREKIDLDVQTRLTTAASEIDSWYAQRLGEIGVFASSEALTAGLPRALREGDSKPGSESERAEREVTKYLTYLLADFPQFDALFILPAGGSSVAFSVGGAADLPAPWLEDLAAISEARVGPIASWSGQHIQIASAPIEDAEGRLVATLHATLRTAHISAILESDGTDDSVALSVVDRDGSVIASNDRGLLGQKFGGKLPDRSAGLRVHLEDYVTADGRSLVGGMRPVDRFDWWLVYEQPYENAFAPVVAAISRVTFINLAIVVVMCLAAFRIAVSIVRPIEALSEAAQRISDGERDVEIPEQPGTDEVAVLTRVFRDMTRTLTRNAAEIERSYATIEETNYRLQQKNEELQEMNEILEQLSITDGLTKLHNHRHFQEALAGECKRADRTGEPLALILIDIDEFKRWNDRLGHAGGDEILRKMAGILNADVRETDVLARYGGEEFALLCPGTDMAGAANLAEKLRTDIAEYRFFFDPPSEHSRVTISAGVALYSGDRQRLFNEADHALYRAKDAGRDCVARADEQSLAAGDSKRGSDEA